MVEKRSSSSLLSKALLPGIANFLELHVLVEIYELLAARVATHANRAI